MALFLMKNKSMFYDNELTYKLINLNLENDHVQLEKAFDIYKKILEPIINIKQYDKIGIQDSSNVELFSNNTYLNSVKTICCSGSNSNLFFCRILGDDLAINIENSVIGAKETVKRPIRTNHATFWTKN